jgi:hypothetical protein
MPPTITAFWNKLNSNEKMVMYGGIIVIIAFLLGTIRGGYGSASGDVVAAIVIAVLYWLKYSPNKINWPAPIQTIVLVIAGISAIFAILGALGWLGILGIDLYAIAIILNAVGCGVMAWFAYKEYQAMPKAAAPPPPAPPAAAPPPPAPPAV